MYNFADTLTLYSNKTSKVLLERPFQAQRIAACSVFIGFTERKLQAFEILDIYALVHYTEAPHSGEILGTGRTGSPIKSFGMRRAQDKY